jgi:hypothetical protein
MTVLGSAIEAQMSDDGGGMDAMRRGGDNTSALDDMIDDMTDSHATKSKGVEESGAEDEAAAGGKGPSLRRMESIARVEGIEDCPLTCSPAAITSCMPALLAAVRTADPGVELARVWTTMLCISVLERLSTSWIWGDGCVRAGVAWSAARCCAWPARGSRARACTLPL